MLYYYDKPNQSNHCFTARSSCWRLLAHVRHLPPFNSPLKRSATLLDLSFSRSTESYMVEKECNLGKTSKRTCPLQKNGHLLCTSDIWLGFQPPHHTPPPPSLRGFLEDTVEWIICHELILLIHIFVWHVASAVESSLTEQKKLPHKWSVAKFTNNRSKNVFFETWN